MTVPLVHGSKAIGPLHRSHATTSGTRSWFDDRSPMATIAVAAILILVWMGALIGFYLAVARHF
jgi:hypothetical protein